MRSGVERDRYASLWLAIIGRPASVLQFPPAPKLKTTAMDTVVSGEHLPATERALVGLCHALNDQLAALNAYVFLLERRGALDESDAPLREHLDNLALRVRLIRFLARDPRPDVSPVSVTLLTEAATAVMDGFPEGSIVFETADAEEGPVVRADWNRAVRALLVAGAWASRGGGEGRRVTVQLESRHALEVRSSETLPPGDDELRFDDSDVRIDPTGPRSARILLPSTS